MSKREEKTEQAVPVEEGFDSVFIEEEDGTEREYRVLMYLEPDGLEHKYVILEPADASDDDDEIQLEAYRYTEQDDVLQLEPIPDENEEEWNMVLETFDALCEDEDGEPLEEHK